MSMRAATMSQIGTMDNPPASQESDSLFRKAFLLLLLVSAAALWIVILFDGRADFPRLLSTFFADASLGLVAGFGTRFVLQKQALFVRFIVAIILAVAGMIMIGPFTNWVLGVGPIRLDARVADQIHKITLEQNILTQIHSSKINARTLFDFSKLDWADSVHLAISLLMAGLALYAWRRAPVPEPAEMTPLPPPSTSPRVRRGRHTSSASNGRARIHLPGSWFSRLTTSPAPQPQTRSNHRSQPRVRSEAKKVKDAAVHPKRRRFRRRPKIQFALVEEHRCPYCLDIVTRNDPRGVKECEVCHSLHHADCWAITGMCQVPHLNN